MKMKIDEFLCEPIDIDVIDDVTDDLWIAFCGPMRLTDEGAKEFESVLDLDIMVYHRWRGDVACVCLDGLDNWEELEKKCIEFFEAMAGYCTVEEWDKWFIDVD